MYLSAESADRARCGCTTPAHPTLGTAFLIQHEIIQAPVDSVVLNLQVGPIPVTFEGDVVWMRQVPPQFGGVVEAEGIAQTLQIPVEEIDRRFPVQLVSTGLPFLRVPLRHLETVKGLNLNWDLFVQLTMGAYPRAMLVFCLETVSPDNQLHARGFVPEVGVPEDPATGSANGCLAGYLAKYRYFGTSEVDVRVEQGYEIKRPSLLFLRAQERDGTIEVNVGGKAILVARGELV
jgi:trans-2,3-dihydro-3-hydroxyanthranilate isomerase